MRTTVTLDDALLSQAQNLSGLNDRGVLLKEALRALIERESARRLIKLGGTEAQLKDIPRRRDPAK
jgi:Arc/MetJ family transcription regulator